MTILDALDRCPICDQIECDHTEDEQVDAASRLAAGQEPLTLASDPAQQSKKARNEKAREKHRDAALEWVLKDPRGRSFVWELLGKCGLWRSSFLFSKGDPLAMAFAEGERNVGLSYLNEIGAKQPELYRLMQQENGGA